MTAAGLARYASRTPRRELTLLLVLGAAGAGLVLLATRQDWAYVHTAAPRPLPAGVIAESGQALAPAAGALALAALASLAAVVATRRLARRIAGVILAGFGAGAAAAVSAGISAADVLAAAAGGAGSQAGAAGTAGSTISGSLGSAAAGPPLSGLASHVVFAAFPWRPVAVAGSIAVIAAGVLVTWRAQRLPVMSARFDRPGARAGAGRPASAAAGTTAAAGAAGGGRAGGASPAPAAGRRARDDSPAALWESLSRGEDPTQAAGQQGQARLQ